MDVASIIILESTVQTIAMVHAHGTRYVDNADFLTRAFKLSAGAP